MQDDQHKVLSKLVDNLYDIIDQCKEQAETHLNVVIDSTDIETSLEDLLHYYEQLEDQELSIEEDIGLIQATIEESLTSLNILVEQHFRNETATVANFEHVARTCIQKGLPIDRSVIYHRVYSCQTKCNSEKGSMICF